METAIKRRPVHLLNQKDLDTWSVVVGGIVMNHGIVEFVSLQWILHLSKESVLRDVAADLPFSKRIEIIKTLVARTDWPKAKKQQANDIWTQVSELSKERNRFVHNPICTRANSEGKIEVGILESRKMKKLGPLALSPVTLQGIADTGRRLAKLLGSLQEFLGWMNNPCAKATTPSR